MYSAGRSASIPGLARATRVVTPTSHSGSRTSSRCEIRSGTRPDSNSNRQNRLDGPAARNPVAQTPLRRVKKGDRIFSYHTGDEKAGVGTPRAAGNAYPEPSDNTGKLFAADVEPVKKLKAPVTLAAIKADKRFASFVLTRVPRLSVMPVSPDEWD